MENQKLYFIYNPRAGKGQIKNHMVRILDIFAKEGYEITIYPTKYPGDAVTAVQNVADGYDLCVCSGGDGTLDEVVTGMMKREKKLPIGYIPAGSTNDFAKSLKIPKMMEKAAEAIVRDERFSCDIGSFNDDVFVYIAAFGLFTDVSYGTPQEIKNVLGHMAYLLEGMRRLPAVSNAYRLRVESNGKQIEEDFIFGMVTNSFSVGGFKSITGKYVKLNDGLFEVTLIKRPQNPLEMQGIMTALLAQETDERYMYSFKTKEIIIEAQKKIPWTLDGEFGGEHKKVRIKNNRETLEFIVPERKLKMLP
ncbi:MAG: YegS/Rv2252/BmrU family lipid kinase [bacterium]|nr:YegS/Rv2252/BmrU family lipid kinase [bacterium]